ncbi:Transcription activator of gluconeoproteinsis ERT1-1 [Sphaceloma murrayae]|uniref:Transcription activator of gluconeoproteinsis ERT1-1 n=1 Tax=Sphaceloma murrayae TaxID=2082308 RepID=A0A2K1QX89_9PEZI|nr:Transcription activator of gluconeoproteinsis ERT1-1 [Sphaceloma murrayae]
MPPKKRISHAKSRSGCANCKKRHVKCDEQGPPCANCIARESAATCTFPSRSSDPSTQSLAVIRQSPITSSSSSSATPSETRQYYQVDPQTNATLHLTHQVPISPSLDPPTPFDASPISNRLLELELLHRWTTTSYESLCSIPEDIPTLTLGIPRLGLRYPFLLHGVLAMAALESSITTPSHTAARTYLHASILYYDLASRSFRAHLPRLTTSSELQYSLYMFSALIMALTPGIPLCCRVQGGSLPSWAQDQGDDILAKVVQLFEMQMGMIQVALADLPGFMSSDYGPAMVRASGILQETMRFPLDDDRQRVMVRLAEIVRKNGEPEALCKALIALRVCFIEEKRGLIRGLSLAFPVMAERPYIDEIKRGDHIALYILMHWGVLLDAVGKYTWWATSLGRTLVDDLSEKMMLSSAPEATMLEWWEGIAWVRSQVGLDDLQADTGIPLEDLSL